MIFEKIQLKDEPANICIDAYIPDEIPGLKRKSILVIPGGGYSCICNDREGEPIALSFLEKGYNAYVLHYSVAHEKNFPAQLIQASKAICYIRENSEKYGANPDEIFAVGFSAGAHLAGSLAILSDREDVLSAVGCEKGFNKPNGAMLIYPVVSCEEFGHIDSFKNLFEDSEEGRKRFNEASLEKHVTMDSAPMFLAHTSNDQLVNVKNSLALANAYAELGRTFELHVFPDAPHGVALGNKITKCGEEKFDQPSIARWVEMADYWASHLK